MAVIALKKLEDQLNCSIYLDTYTDPKQLQCHHVYCQKCLVKLAIRDQQGQLILTCPNCRHVTPVPSGGVRELQPAFQINQLLEIVEEHKASTSQNEEGGEAISNPQNEVAAGCPDHNGREIELYCNTCEEIICFKCIMKDEKHHSHDYQELDAAFERYKNEISLSLEPLEKQVFTIEEAVKQLDKCENEVVDQQAAIEKDINKAITKMQKLLDTRKTELITQLHRLTQAKLKSLAAQRDQLEITQARLKSCLHFIMGTLQADNQAETLMRTSRVKQIKDLIAAFQPNLLKPVTEADLVFLAKAEYAKKCQSFGLVSTRTSPDPSKCYVASKGIDTARIGEECTAVVQILNFNEKPCEVSDIAFTSDITSQVTGITTKITTQRQSESQYEIRYQPTFKGNHFLHIRVQDKPIKGSPFPVTVKLPIERLGLASHTVDGVVDPESATINQQGNIIVTDRFCGKRCVSVISPSGERLSTFSADISWPIGVAVDDEGRLVVADISTDQIHMFSASGKLLARVGSSGIGPLKFYMPCSIAYNSSNRMVYVGDLNHTIQILNSDMLGYVSAFGKKGIGKGQFDHPEAIAFDSSGSDVFVADCRNHRIQVFTAEGKFLRVFGKYGAGKGELNRPHGIALDSSDRVYVSERRNHRVSVFTSGGQFVTSFGSEGAGPGQLIEPRRLAVDHNGVVYVCDHGNNRIQLF